MNEGKKFYVTAKSILSAAGLNLRKWVTNDEDLQQFFDQNENAKADIDSNQGDDVTFLNSQLKFDKNKSKSVLGVEWNTKTDEFVFRFSNLVDQAKSLENTKRNVFKVSASFYDPLGMIFPVTARVKTTFQLLCQDKLNWDDSVPREIDIIWDEFISNLDEWEKHPSLFRVKIHLQFHIAQWTMLANFLYESKRNYQFPKGPHTMKCYYCKLFLNIFHVIY